MKSNLAGKKQTQHASFSPTKLSFHTDDAVLNKQIARLERVFGET